MHQMIAVLFIVLVVVNVCDLMKNECPNVKMPMLLARKRRHLAFPDNSNAVLTASLVCAFMTHIPAGWNLALELDVLFPLPDLNFTVAHTHRKKLHHRQKKELWNKFHEALSFHNLDGRACLLKSICEAKVYLAPPGKSLVHDILRAIFTYEIVLRVRGYRPELTLNTVFLGNLNLWYARALLLLEMYLTSKRLRVPEMDQEFRNEVEGSYDELLTPDFCDQIGHCPLSLLNFILSLNQKKH